MNNLLSTAAFALMLLTVYYIFGKTGVVFYIIGFAVGHLIDYIRS